MIIAIYVIGFFLALAWGWLRALRAGYYDLPFEHPLRMDKSNMQFSVFFLSATWPVSVPWRCALIWARSQYQREQTREAERLLATKTLELEERRLALEERVVDQQLRDQGVIP